MLFSYKTLYVSSFVSCVPNRPTTVFEFAYMKVFQTGLTSLFWQLNLLILENRQREIVDPQCEGVQTESLDALLSIAIQCVSSAPEDRPTMHRVVQILESEVTTPCPSDFYDSGSDWRELQRRDKEIFYVRGIASVASHKLNSKWSKDIYRLKSGRGTIYSCADRLLGESAISVWRKSCSKRANWFAELSCGALSTWQILPPPPVVLRPLFFSIYFPFSHIFVHVNEILVPSSMLFHLLPFVASL